MSARGVDDVDFVAQGLVLGVTGTGDTTTFCFEGRAMSFARPPRSAGGALCTSDDNGMTTCNKRPRDGKERKTIKRGEDNEMNRLIRFAC